MKNSHQTRTPVILMAFSLILLVVLQGLWLRTEYNSALNSFSRETNIIFRSTLHQMADSVFFGSIQNIVNDSLAKKGLKKLEGLTIDGIRKIDITHQKNEDIIEENGDTIENDSKRISVLIMNPDNPKDSIIVRGETSRGRQDMRWVFSDELTGYDADSIAHFYRSNLSPEFARLSFKVLEKEFNFPHSRSQGRMSADSLPFTTSWYPFAQKLYAIEFENGNGLIMSKLLPQFGFSILTTGLILFSFLMVYRSLRSQKRLMEQKDSFINNVTHELKTPVASVGVAIEAIKNFNVHNNKEKTMEYLDLANLELERLTNLIEKILNTSVIDYHKEIRQNQRMVNVGSIIENVISSFKLTAQKRNMDVQIAKNGNLQVNANEEHLTQAIYNLVDNAFKYAHEGKYLKISIGELPHEVMLEIEDKGPGISHEHHARIFEKFYRIPTGNVHNVKGYGLGLHYVKGVVEQHDGIITLESLPGEGCKFIVKIKKQHP
jgi:two-component system phosphate regulon sensor histidine kinase PhoR